MAMAAARSERHPADPMNDALRMQADPNVARARSVAAQRRQMQAAMAAAVMALRSQERRRIGSRQPPGGLL
jgi:hypothetical protein